MHLVYGLCLKYFKNREESQDASMLIFEKLIDAVKKHEIQNFKSWLYVLSKNHCLMTLRSKKTKGIEVDIETETTIMESTYQLHPMDENDLEDDLTKLEKCISELQDEQKRCVEMFFLNKRPYQFIANETGFEIKKVKSYIQNGKRNLKICMESNSE